MNQEIKLDKLSYFLARKKTFLVCGRSFDQLCIKEDVERACGEIFRFSDFSPNPQYEDICKGVDLFRSENCDAILAVGGGSAIDVAKSIKLFSTMDPGDIYLDQTPVASDILFIAIPTTAGSGSESTRHIVLYYMGEKRSISHNMALPDYYVLEPMVLQGLSQYQKKCTMLDALCQGIESWWSVNSTEQSIVFSEDVVRRIVANWAEYIEDNTVHAARQIMMASNSAGKAINITSTTAAHAMSYKLTTMFDIPHGHAVALCMQHVWEYLLDHIPQCIDIRGTEHLQVVLNDIQRQISLDYFKQMCINLEMRCPVSRDKSNQLEELTESVNLVRLRNYPVAIQEDDIKRIYARILQDES